MVQNYNQNEVQSTWDKIQSATNITLLTHFNPDGDGISACAAMERVLLGLNKNVETIYPTKAELPPKHQPKTILVNEHRQTPELLIAFDTATISRLYYPEEFQSIPLINIDHHISNNIDAEINIINAKSSSASEMLYDLLKMWSPESIDSYVAECIMFGIMYDTQIFQVQSTSSNTLRAAAELMDLGANVSTLKYDLLSHKDPSIIAFWGHLLSNVNIEKQAAWIVITQDDLKKFNVKPSSTVGFVNFLNQISNIDISALLYEMESGEVKISLRSRFADVNAIAKNFGGGGHKNASGAMVSEPINVVEEKLIGLFKE